MSNKCCISKGKSLGFSFYSQMKIQFREMTIGHPPQHEEKDPRTSNLP